MKRERDGSENEEGGGKREGDKRRENYLACVETSVVRIM